MSPSLLFEHLLIKTAFFRVIAIVAVKYCVKILHLRITDLFLRQFATLSPTERSKDRNTLMPIDSTRWWDLTKLAGRKYFVRHILALISWADDANPLETDSEGTDESMGME